MEIGRAEIVVPMPLVGMRMLMLMGGMLMMVIMMRMGRPMMMIIIPKQPGTYRILGAVLLKIEHMQLQLDEMTSQLTGVNEPPEN